MQTMKRSNKSAAASSAVETLISAFFQRNDSVSFTPERKCLLNPMKIMGIFLVLLMCFSLLFSVTVVLKDPTSDVLWTLVDDMKFNIRVHKALKHEEILSQPVQLPRDELLSDLLQSGFAENSCLSRYQSVPYRNKTSSISPSNLISKLRGYKTQHKKCGPFPKSYTDTAQDLKSGKYSSNYDKTQDKEPLVQQKDDKRYSDDLLPSLLDENSCLSRYQSLLYRKKKPQKASSYLISKLRNYEARHKKCGPLTESYNKTVEYMNNSSIVVNSDCKYVVWIWFSGLGNRMMTLTSAFLYALLTDRVLLVDPGVDIPDLFCEPFPETSWLLPLDFPLAPYLNSFHENSPVSYYHMLKTSSSFLTDAAPPSYIYLHLVSDYYHNNQIFCDKEQSSLHKVPWLIIKSDNYFVPYLFLTPTFDQELHHLFPNKETVFHHLGRYLFNPTNSVWGIITRYYQSYLSRADEIVGIQIRVFGQRPDPFKLILDQILGCNMEKHILPKVKKEQDEEDRTKKNETTLVAVLMTSLKLGYFDEISNLYKENPTETGELVAVYQPSHEELQQNQKPNHNTKALVEMFLLSFSDKLITSGWSTFGYVAQGLGGLKPWMLYRPENGTVPHPQCTRLLSIEPCFHDPPTYDCKLRTTADPGTILPYVKHCQDAIKGIKLVNPSTH